MSTSLNLLTEDTRQRRTGDSLYYRRLPPIFELRVPAKITQGLGTSFLFPLPIPPQMIRTEYPFAVEISPTLGGGLVVERSGVLQVEIRLQGTMGQRLKPYRGSQFGYIEVEDRQLSDRDVVKRTMPGYSLSGHRFLMHLRDSIFGLYSDLVRDPEISEEVQLVLHLPKTDEHYVVEPRSFTIPQQAHRSWEYEIVLTGIALAKALPEPDEDSSILSKISNAIQTVRGAIRLARAVINDLNQIRAELEGFVRKITGAIDDLASVFEAAEEFVDGTTRAVSTSRTRVESSIARLEDALAEEGDQIGDTTAHLLNEVLDAAHEMLLHPEIFEPDPKQAVEDAFRRGLGLFGRDRSGLLAASGNTPPATEADLAETDTLASDLVRDDRARALPEELRRYRSSFRTTLGAEDTLQGLAAQHLGDARLWRHIALLNGLLDPYVSELGLPYTIAPGQEILIPSTETQSRQLANPAVLGVLPFDPADVRELGTDFLVSWDATGREDWNLDAEGGLVDLAIARGVDCLAQGLRARVELEKGSDPMYRKLGLERVQSFGAGQDIEDEAWKLKISEALEADPRIVRAVEVVLSTPAVGTRETEASVLVRNRRKPLAVQASTPI